MLDMSHVTTVTLLAQTGRGECTPARGCALDAQLVLHKINTGKWCSLEELDKTLNVHPTSLTIL